MFSPARARNASGQGVSLSVLGAVRAAELRSGSMGSILSNRTDSGCVTRSDPISASRTASRFGFCQPFSDLLGPLLTFDSLNKYGIFWDFRLGGIGSGDRRFSAGSLPNLLGRVPEVRTVGWPPSSRCSWLAWSSVHGCGLRACSGIRGRSRVSVLPDRACVLQVRRLGAGAEPFDLDDRHVRVAAFDDAHPARAGRRA